MSLLARLLKPTPPKPAIPDIRFGRYTDSYKLSAHHRAWDMAVEAFEAGQYLNSFRAFLEYLRNEQEDNVQWKDEGASISFELYQGSRKVTGIANTRHVKAEAKIAKANRLHVAFMRRLVEHNFNLSYCRYALDNTDHIVLMFDTFTLDGSPYKLYYALKELATHADKQDDLLLEEYEDLQPITTAPVWALSEHERQVKYEYILREIQAVLKIWESNRIDKDQYAGGMGYLLLQLIYKLDYLTQPQGYTMEALERMHRLYFSGDDKSAAQKNLILIKELRQLAARPAEQFYKELYRTSATFGITTLVNHAMIADFIKGELPNMDWYYEHGYHDIALAVPGFVVGYCLFNYALPKPVRDLMHLYIHITEADFFEQLGIPSPWRQAGTLQPRAVRQAIARIVAANKKEYPGLNPATSSLQFKDLPTFARTFLNMIAEMEVIKM